MTIGKAGSRLLCAGAMLLLLAGCAAEYGADRGSYYGRHDCHYYGDCDHGGYFR